MSVMVVVGAQWGDEGKGKVVDLLTENADVVVRYGGGANAGHTLVVGGAKVVLHLVPSGVLHKHTTCVLGPGTVIDPAVLLEELRVLDEKGFNASSRVFVSDRAHLVMPHHKVIDGLREARAGAIGTTKRGIGPCYEDKTGRRGVRAGDLRDRRKLEARVRAAHEAWAPFVASLGEKLPPVDEIVANYEAFGKRLGAQIVDASALIGAAEREGKRIVCEGAQGTLLDLDHGTYPFVTSSTTISGGACAGAGIGPTSIDEVVGITKAYATRVGGGPFPTELDDETGESIRRIGGEFGATTGRPRRCGWMDMLALRYAVRVNGMTSLAMTKLDVLTGFAKIALCVAYERDGKRLDELPYDDLDDCTPVYEWHDGWTEDLGAVRAFAALPENAKRYVARLQELAGVPIAWVGVGPDRVQTITR